MLLREDADKDLFNPDHKAVEHHCFRLEDRPEGKLECTSSHVQLKQVPAKLKDIEHRDNQISKLVSAVMEQETRLICLVGLPGIGKSSIAKCALHFLLERRYFTGGVILINLKNVRLCQVFTNKIKKVIIKALKLPHGSDLQQEIEKAKDEPWHDILEKFFKQKNPDYLLQRKPRLARQN